MITITGIDVAIIIPTGEPVNVIDVKGSTVEVRDAFGGYARMSANDILGIADDVTYFISVKGGGFTGVLKGSTIIEMIKGSAGDIRWDIAVAS